MKNIIEKVVETIESMNHYKIIDLHNEYCENNCFEEYSPISISEIADYIVKNKDSLGNSDIQEILDEFEEE